MNSTDDPGRATGILIPMFSLPGEGSRGTFDDAAAFGRFLSEAGMSVWQVLPLGPTHEDRSPYLSLSAHAGNPEYIGAHCMVEAGLIGSADGGCDNAIDESLALLAADGATARQFQSFCDDHRFWLDDFVLFMLLRKQHEGAHWYDWPPPYRDRDPEELAAVNERHGGTLTRLRWEQYLFFSQWHAVRARCNEAGVRLLGDIPLYVSHDSADVWAHRHLFSVDAAGTARAVAGVPPDYFSQTGQRWGNPLYDWDAHRADDYRWWVERIRGQMEMYDLLRIDHFRGLEAYWEIPADAPGAAEGSWRPGPGRELLRALHERIPGLRLVAEDLGTITREVDELRRAFSIPGMRVLQFGFDGREDNPHAPHNLDASNLVYTGTHDNDTSLSWYSSLPGWQRELVDRILQPYQEPFPLKLVECAMQSPATLVMLPMQDLLGLGTDARINTPGTMRGNWEWRLDPAWPRQQVIDTLLRLKARYRR